MTPVRILVDSLADSGLTNAQMTNAREIIRRLDSNRFHASVFCGGEPDELFDWGPITRRWEEVFLDLMSRKTAARAA